jgi:hypothetical protein
MELQLHDSRIQRSMRINKVWQPGGAVTTDAENESLPTSQRACAQQQTGSMAPILSQADHLSDGQHGERHERVLVLPYLLTSSKQPDSLFLLTNTVVDVMGTGHSPRG